MLTERHKRSCAAPQAEKVVMALRAAALALLCLLATGFLTPQPAKAGDIFQQKGCEWYEKVAEGSALDSGRSVTLKLYFGKKMTNFHNTVVSCGVAKAVGTVSGQVESDIYYFGVQGMDAVGNLGNILPHSSAGLVVDSGPVLISADPSLRVAKAYAWRGNSPPFITILIQIPY